MEDIPSKPSSIKGDLKRGFFVEINLHSTKKWLISCSYNPKRASVANHISALSKSTDIWGKIFKSGLSKFCGRQPLKNLLSPLLNTLSHIYL